MSLTTIQPSGVYTGSQFSFNSIAITSTGTSSLTVAGGVTIAGNVLVTGSLVSTGTFTVVASTATI